MAGVPIELLQSPWIVGLVGLAVGSFLNVVIHRLPLILERQWWTDVLHQLRDETSFRRIFNQAAPGTIRQTADQLEQALAGLSPLGLARPASRCPACATPIRWYQNVPLLSWLWLRGRCATCRAAITVRYPAIELMCAALFAAVAWRMNAQPALWLWCGFTAVLVALSMIDWDTTVLPDFLTLPLLWTGLLVAALGWTIPLPHAVAGAIAGYLSLWSVYWLFKLATGKEGMGFGDFKLLAALGAWLGWQALLPIILGASILGAVIGIVMKATGALREGRFVPFGPFLAGSGMAVMLIGTRRTLDWLGWT